MILTAFRLTRDRHTERDSFGHTRPVTSQIRRMPSFSPTLGCPIELPSPTTIKTNIIKMVEYYHRNTGPIVVERLMWRFGTSLYPYRARFIHIDKEHIASDVDILFLQNMSKIHQILTGNNVSFASPIQYHFNTATPPWHNKHLHERLHELNDKYREWINSFAYAHDHWGDTEQFVEKFDLYDHYPDRLEEEFRQYVIPKIKLRDPFTMNYHARPLSVGGLVFERPPCNIFDTSPPLELSINHPEKTLYSPKVYPVTIETLNQLALQYSDLNIEYILSGRAVVQFQTHYLVSRYRDRILLSAVPECQGIIINDVLEILYQNYHDMRLLGDIRVTFVMTYGEEVLIEVFDYDSNQCIGCVHFDLAMLTLCATNIATYVDPF